MPTSVTSPPFPLHAGTDVSASVDITSAYTAGDTNYFVGYDSRPWLTTDTLTLTVQFSPDNGVTWGWGCAETTTGGSHLSSKGVEVGCSCAGNLPGSASFPNPDGWPAQPPAKVLARVSATVPTTQTTTATIKTS